MAARCTVQRLEEIRQQIERLDESPSDEVFGYEIRRQGLRVLEARMSEACALAA
jgi:hypothetical protein